MPKKTPEKALVLVSGGPDSATLVGWALKQGYVPTLLNFQFGLRTDKPELRAARTVAGHYKLALDVIDIADVVAMLGHTRLNHPYQKRPNGDPPAMSFGSAILLSIASVYAILKNANHVLVALHSADAEESPVYRPPFLQAIQHALAIARGNDDISITAPIHQDDQGASIQDRCIPPSASPAFVELFRWQHDSMWQLSSLPRPKECLPKGRYTGQNQIQDITQPPNQALQPTTGRSEANLGHDFNTSITD
jgi:7-cyano-7-deazaguanine synthase